MLYSPIKVNSNTIAIVGNITAHHHGKKNVCAECVSSINGYIICVHVMEDNA